MFQSRLGCRINADKDSSGISIKHLKKTRVEKSSTRVFIWLWYQKSSNTAFDKQSSQTVSYSLTGL
jgi:hypothetical protein